MTIQIQMLKYQTLCPPSGIWALALVIAWGCCSGAVMPRHMRYIDKRKAAVMINPSYFGKLTDLPIDKIDIIVLEYCKPAKRAVFLCVLTQE
jgi:hypothetical protein